MNAENTKTMNEQLKIIVRGAYQVQKLRIQTGNRIVGNFKNKLGQEPGSSEKDLEKQAKELLDNLRNDYKTLTEGVARFPSNKKFKAEGLISSYTELCMLEQYFELEKSEDGHFKRIKQTLENYPIWTGYLEGVKGIGPALAGVIISEIDITKAEYPTSLWRLAGLDVAWDNRGRSKRREHLVTTSYINRSGQTAEKLSITYKPMLKTKLMGVAAASFLRCGVSSPYAVAYYDYKNRLEQHPEHRDAFIALDIKECKQELGYIPTRVYRREYVTDYYNRCDGYVRGYIVEKDYLDVEGNLNVTAFEKAVTDEIKRLCKANLGKYEILENLKIMNIAIGSFYNEDSLSEEVSLHGGVLRKSKEIEVFIDSETDMGPNDNGIDTVEEFDSTPDKRGRKLYKQMNIGKTKAHRHQMASRYAIKRFLVDLHREWRTIAGLPVAEEYGIAKLGLVHGVASPGKVKSAMNDDYDPLNEIMLSRQRSS